MLKDVRSNDREKDIFYSSDSELSHEDQHYMKLNKSGVEQKVKRSDSRFATSRRESFNSRGSSSIDRSSSVSLEEKLYEREMIKLRKMSEFRSASGSLDEEDQIND